MLGVSYHGWTTIMAAVEPHAALRKETEQFTFDRYDTYDWYLSLGLLPHVNERVLRGRILTWNDYVAHPDYDALWQR